MLDELTKIYARTTTKRLFCSACSSLEGTAKQDTKVKTAREKTVSFFFSSERTKTIEIEPLSYC